MRKLKFLHGFLFKREPKKRASLDIQLMIFFYEKKIPYLTKIWRRKIYYKYFMDIDSRAKIHSSTKFDHPLGVVIGEGAIIDKDVTILQGVTIGGSFTSKNQQTINSGTTIGAGAKILGNVSIGKNCIIGANAVITKSVPDGSVAVSYNKIINKSSSAYL